MSRTPTASRPPLPTTLARLAAELHPDPEALGEAVAARILAGIRAAGDRPYLLGCPGGRSARSTYLALGRQAAAARASLARLVIIMMDNYVVPAPAGGYRHCPDDAHYSCRRFAVDEIWRPLNAGLAPGARLPAEQVWLPDPAEPDAYERRLEQAGGVDLFLIASGASDGHVAFNPPGSAAESVTRIIPLAEATRRDNLGTFPAFGGRLADVPKHGVSVGLGTIAGRSREVVLILHGAHKHYAFNRLAALGDFDPAWPASIIHRCRQPRLVLDRAALTGTAGA